MVAVKLSDPILHKTSDFSTCVSRPSNGIAMNSWASSCWRPALSRQGERGGRGNGGFQEVPIVQIFILMVVDILEVKMLVSFHSHGICLIIQGSHEDSTYVAWISPMCVETSYPYIKPKKLFKGKSFLQTDDQVSQVYSDLHTIQESWK